MGEAADLRHVITCACKGIRGRGTYLARMQRLTERLERIVPKPMRAEPTMSTPIAAWTCACRVRVRRARDAVATLRKGGSVSDEQWHAMQSVIAGVLPRCSKEDEMAHGKDAAKWKRIVEGVSEVVRLMQTETLAMMEGRWEVMREAREAAAHEDAQERELMRAVDDAEREERERRERQEQQEHERDERVRAAAAEYQRRAHLRGGDAVATTRAIQHGAAEGAAQCDKGCEHRWAGVCEGCRWRAAAVCPACIHTHGIASTGCTRCRREVQGACGGCVEAVRRMCETCRETARQGGDSGQRRRRGDGSAAAAAADGEGAGAPGKRKRRAPMAAPAGAPRGEREHSHLRASGRRPSRRSRRSAIRRGGGGGRWGGRV